MADVVALAQDLWDLAWDDPAYAATLQEDHKNALKSVASGSNVGDVINGSKNGSTYTIRIGFTLQDRIRAMGLAVKGIKSGYRPSRTRQIRFR